MFLQFDGKGNVKSSSLDVTIGVIFVVLAILAVIADIWTTKEIADAGLRERNPLFQDANHRPVMWKLILYKSIMMVITVIASLILVYYGAGYFASFVYIGVFLVNGVTAYNNRKLLQKHRARNAPKM